MNQARIAEIFLLISGEESETPFMDIIYLAMHETDSMLRPGVDISDIRLSFLAAAIANYRLQQMYAARERSAVTYAGKLPKQPKNIACKCAGEIVKDYMRICESMLKVSDFVFSSFSGRGEEIK